MPTGEVLLRPADDGVQRVARRHPELIRGRFEAVERVPTEVVCADAVTRIVTWVSVEPLRGA